MDVDRLRVRPERADELLAATRQILADVQVTPDTEASLASIRERNRRDREEALRTNEFWLSSLVGALHKGEKPEVITTFDARNEALTPVVVRDFLAELLGDPERSVITGVLGPGVE